ncbi:MAG: alanine racemase [Magnetococcales bacterium]|nr:alanine racemase [Magnetococcales bacterium]
MPNRATTKAGGPPLRPNWLEIDLGAVVHNYRVAQKCVGSEVEVWPVVKADGYGLGAVAVAQALRGVGAAGFCVALLEEGIALRAAGITQPVILFSGLSGGCVEQAAQWGLEPFLYEPASDLATLAAAAPGRPLRVHIKVDTGMGRMGIAPSEVAAFLAALDRLGDRVRVVGMVSHLACADERQRPETARQLAVLQELLAQPELAGRNLRISLANSAGLLGYPAARYHWVRPGIMLYGASPFYPEGSWRQLGLRPVVAWRSRIIQLRNMPAGTPLGYGHSVTTTRPSRLAQVPVGYGDGYNRRLGGRGQVLIAGRRAPVIGRVCMDLITVDVTDLPTASVGTPVTLLGRDGAEMIDIEEMATWLGTIPYEVICALGRRLPRRYLWMAQVCRTRHDLHAATASCAEGTETEPPPASPLPGLST